MDEARSAMSWEIIRWIDGTGRVQMCSSKEVAERFLTTYPAEERKNYHIREYRPSKLFVPPGECMNTSAEENKRMRGRIARKRREEHAEILHTKDV